MKTYMCKFTLVCCTVLTVLGCGCDEVSSPYKRTIEDGGNTAKFIRKVYLEDYTGYRCGNCPKAAEEATKLIDKYDTNIVVIAIHAGDQFAKPFGQKYKQDFRTTEGEQLFKEYIGNAGQPNGTVNRAAFGGQRVVSYTGWEEKIIEEKNKTPQAWIELQTTLNEVSGILEVKADVTALEDLKANTTLALYLVEDSIYYWQTDYRIKPPADDNIEIYHKHVMRGSIGSGGAYGESLSGSVITKKTKVTKTQTVNLNDTGKFKFLPNKKHLNVVAIVSDPDSREVLQVQEAHVKE